MILKNCEYCGKEINAKIKSRRFCDDVCQRKHYYSRQEVKKRYIEYGKHYNQRPYVKEKARIRIKEYRKNHPEWKEKHRILAVTKYRERRREYWKDYGKRPEVRMRINKKDRIRRETDKQYAIADRLRRSLHNALTTYSKTGKVMSSIKYGIDWKIIIERLKPFPENIKEFEIDHIIPLHSFNLDNPEEIKKAFSPSNLQWLTREENRKKSGKIPKSSQIIL